ncbi:DNA topoisomerase 3-beta-1 [Pelomyxa schiedti]|nr:DNA topoisomerase 3-beta-1 [Pelomyxa schiedti]
MSSDVVLMVAEKPMLAQSIATILSHNTAVARRGVSGSCLVHEYHGSFMGRNAFFKMTSVAGHVFNTDFPPDYQNWSTTDPASLFSAPTRKVEANPKSNLVKHLRKEAKGATALVLWLDCDREGENICFEVIECAMPKMSHPRILRAKFSSITAPDIVKAMSTLGEPNENEARSVDARQELDLRVGVAFTRFQTRYFQGKYGNLDSSLISYGPCQTPTLNFCVDRHDEIQSFMPQPFWTIVPVLEYHGKTMKLKWARKRMFDKDCASLFESLVTRSKVALLQSFNTSESRKKRPLPLNTVELLKIASRQLHMSPHHTMNIAEHLYIQGFISYPRTESSKYSPNFDLRGTLKTQKNNPVWGTYVSNLLKQGLNVPQSGVDAGDHPPITPMASATEDRLGEEEWCLYEYIARHFIATVSADCIIKKSKAVFSIGDEFFSCSSTSVASQGFVTVMPWLAGDDLPDLSAAKQVPVKEVQLQQSQTVAPTHLTESELITLMEKFGIGTDASIPLHINNICERNFARVGANRTLVPTKLGIALVHGYHKIDSDLVLPTVRANIEQNISLIAKGEAEYGIVVFCPVGKKLSLLLQIEHMDQLFEASFSNVASTKGKLLTKCGKCRRYLKYLPCKPSRLYCMNCEDTYSLPQNGSIKEYEGHLCPLDNFGLTLFTNVGGKCFSLCPYCYNYPTLPDMKKNSGCNNCTHPACVHSFSSKTISHCPECDTGVLILDPSVPPKASASCNRCAFLLRFPDTAKKVTLEDEDCDTCGATPITMTFGKTSPLPDGAQSLTACVYCDETMGQLCGHSHIRFKPGGRGGGRGRGRGGRGRRGRGRGRGRRGGGAERGGGPSGGGHRGGGGGVRGGGARGGGKS